MEVVSIFMIFKLLNLGELPKGQVVEKRRGPRPELALWDSVSLRGLGDGEESSQEAEKKPPGRFQRVGHPGSQAEQGDERERVKLGLKQGFKWMKSGT